MDINSSEQRAEALGEGIQRSAAGMENRAVRLAESTNAPAVLHGQDTYGRRQELLSRAQALLAQEGQAVIGTVARMAMQDMQEALKLEGM